MYDPSQLIHDTPLRRQALASEHLMARKSPMPALPGSLRGLPNLLAAVLGGVFVGGWFL